MKKLTLKRGIQFGPWTLEDNLGYGGNAEVWQAVSTNNRPVALKVLTRNWSSQVSEPFQRFKIEVDTLARLRNHHGIVPMLDASLEIDKSQGIRPWMAMPVAIPIREALSETPSLPEVVEAIAEIAQTLAELAARFSIYHRDIKPPNLFRLNDRWCVGDFGLVQLPDKSSLTEEGRKLGPQYFIAPELLNDHSAQPGPGDVFALAKSLWVLATGQIFPWQGVLEHDDSHTRLTSYLGLRTNCRAIELLLARATGNNPQARPTMQEFSDELRAWASPALTPSAPAYSNSLLTRARLLLTSHESSHVLARAREERVSAIAIAADKFIQASIVPRLQEHGLRGGSGRPLEELAPETIPEDFRKDVVLNFGPSLDYMFMLGDRKRSVHITMNFNVRLTQHGETRITAATVVRDNAGWKEVIWFESRAAHTQSAIEQMFIDELLQGLSTSGPAAIDALLRKIDALSIEYGGTTS